MNTLTKDEKRKLFEPIQTQRGNQTWCPRLIQFRPDVDQEIESMCLKFINLGLAKENAITIAGSWDLKQKLASLQILDGLSLLDALQQIEENLESDE